MSLPEENFKNKKIGQNFFTPSDLSDLSDLFYLKSFSLSW